MDKKNVMLLTVIAVATLLVAVVGATFAYFSLSATTTNGTASTTTTTQELGTIALNGENKAMHIKLSAADMAKYDTKKTYYATADDTKDYVIDTAEDVTVATATVEGGDANATYTCTGTLSVVTAIKDGSNAYNLAEDKQSQLSGNAVLSGSNVTFGDTAAAVTETTKTYTLAQTLTEKTVYYKITGLSTTADKSILANASFDNTTAEQNDLQGKTITTTVSVKTVNCTVDGNAS